MKKALIAYFSQSGTTKTITQKIAEGLSESDFEVDLHDIRTPLSNINDYDLLGIGSPVYYFRPSINIIEFIKNLPPLNQIPSFTFLIYGKDYGKAGNVLRDEVTKKGAKEIGHAKFKGADMYLGYLQRGILFSPDNPNVEDQNNAKNFGITTANCFSNQEEAALPETEKLSGISIAIEEMLTTKFLIQNVYSRFFSSDKYKCNGCGICVEMCPGNNIHLTEKQLPKWGRNCLACLYCQMKCPKNAISSVVDWPTMNPLINDNIAQGIKDPNTEHVNVIHDKGKTKRVSS